MRNNSKNEVIEKLNAMKVDVESMEFSNSNLTKLDTILKHYAFLVSNLSGNIEHATKIVAAIDFVIGLSEKDEKYYADFVRNLAELYDTKKYPLNDYIGAIYRMCCSEDEFNALSFYPFEYNVIATKLQFNAYRPDGNICTCRGDYCASGGLAIAFAVAAKEKGIDTNKDLFFYGRDCNERNVVLTYLQAQLAHIPAIIRHCDMQTNDKLDYGVFYTGEYLNQKNRIDEYIKM